MNPKLNCNSFYSFFSVYFEIHRGLLFCAPAYLLAVLTLISVEKRLSSSRTPEQMKGLSTSAPIRCDGYDMTFRKKRFFPLFESSCTLGISDISFICSLVLRSHDMFGVSPPPAAEFLHYANNDLLVPMKVKRITFKMSWIPLQHYPSMHSNFFFKSITFILNQTRYSCSKRNHY